MKLHPAYTLRVNYVFIFQQSNKRNREENEIEECSSSSKKSCLSPNHDDKLQDVTPLSENTSLKLREFSSSRTSWEHIITDAEHDLIKLPSGSTSFSQSSFVEQRPSTSTFIPDDNNVKHKTDNKPESHSKLVGFQRDVSPSKHVSKPVSPSKLAGFQRDNNVSNHKQHIPKTECSASKKKTKYTPLEQQVVALKEEHPNILLFVECGYKFRFFGEDAEVGAFRLIFFILLFFKLFSIELIVICHSRFIVSSKIKCINR